MLISVAIILKVSMQYDDLIGHIVQPWPKKVIYHLLNIALLNAMLFIRQVPKY